MFRREQVLLKITKPVQFLLEDYFGASNPSFCQDLQCIKSQIFEADVLLFAGPDTTVPPVGARAATSVASAPRARAPPRGPTALPGCAHARCAWRARTFLPSSRLTHKWEGRNSLPQEACISFRKPARLQEACASNAFMSENQESA